MNLREPLTLYPDISDGKAQDLALEVRANEVFTFLHGRRYVIDGVSGVFHHFCFMARYPYPHVHEELLHVPDAEGKGTETYHVLRRQLCDDWVTDLTDDVEKYSKIALELGYTEEVKGPQKIVAAQNILGGYLQ